MRLLQKKHYSVTKPLKENDMKSLPSSLHGKMSKQDEANVCVKASHDDLETLICIKLSQAEIVVFTGKSASANI